MKNLRDDFPILKQKINGKPFVYFDNGATAQKPQAVIDAVIDFYSNYNANVHRGIHAHGEKATVMYGNAREKMANFIGAQDSSEIIFTRGTTESINLVAMTWTMAHVGEGDEIIVSELEHHSNLFPWQQVAQHKNAVLKFIPVNNDGTLDLSTLPTLFTPRTKMVSVTHTSNMLGTHVDVETITKAAHKVGAKVLVDAAQSSPHQPIDVQKIGCDFLALSGHKMIGPTGIGVLYVAKPMHDEMPPYQFGGGMVYEADFLTASWLPLPNRLEAGTPAIAQAVGLGAAVDYMKQNVDFNELASYEAGLCRTMIDGLSTVKDLRIIGPVEQLKKDGHLVSFVIDGVHAHDVTAFLTEAGISVRAGHHCVQPLAKKMGVPASIRASFWGYNTQEEVEKFVDVLKQLSI